MTMQEYKKVHNVEIMFILLQLTCEAYLNASIGVPFYILIHNYPMDIQRF